MKDLISIEMLTKQEILDLLDFADELKKLQIKQSFRLLTQCQNKVIHVRY